MQCLRSRMLAPTRFLQGVPLRAARPVLHRLYNVDTASSPLPTMSSSQEVLQANHVKVVLLEGIHPAAEKIFRDSGFLVTTYKRALEGQELLDVAADCHILGIRSKTQLTKEFFAHVGTRAHRLWGVGCFCIGTNQVDLQAAASRGVVVFNAPFSNTRSVAELTLSEIIALKRRLFERSSQMHRGEWQKSAVGSHELRGMTLGIIGYGRIGSQVSVLAEFLGLRVVYYDTKQQLSLGNALQLPTMEEVLSMADVVTLHIPSTPGLIGAKELNTMKKGAVLINNARGNIVDIDALAEALKSGQLSGAAVDVFPEEPAKNGSGFECPLRGIENCILSPHIGGSTMEAQEKIADEVAVKLSKLLRNGDTTTAVNVPEVELPQPRGTMHRMLHFHRNVPGVLASINNAVSTLDINVEGQYLKTDEEHGYVIIDVERKNLKDLKDTLAKIPGTIWIRSLTRTGGGWSSWSPDFIGSSTISDEDI